jgi:hypothetical protein
MVFNNINSSQKIGTVTTYGVSLPNASISSEPLLCSVFELNNNPKLMDLSKQVYLAHEAKYNAKGVYIACMTETPHRFHLRMGNLNGDT